MNSGVTEEIEIHQSTVSDWLSNPTQFGVVFSRYCSRMAQSVGYFIEIDEAAVALVHQNWNAQCALWRSERVANGKSLSFMKIFSLLLFQMASVEWVHKIFDSVPALEKTSKAVPNATSQICSTIYSFTCIPRHVTNSPPF